MSSIEKIASVVDYSATCNTSQIECDENGRINVPSFDWVSFLSPHFKRLVNIKKISSLSFSSTTPAVVHFKVNANSDEESIVLEKQLEASLQ